MKLFSGLFWSLVFITVFVQIGSSKIVTKREESNYENGTDIIVVKPELLDVVLTEKNLTFKFCDNNCIEDFLVCYEPASTAQTSYLDLCNSNCGFYVNANKDVFSFMNPFTHMGIVKIGDCFETSMKYNISIAYNGVGAEFESMLGCDPKIENGMIQLNITTASSGCPMTIKNAKIFKEEVPAPNPSSNGNVPSKNNNPESAPPDSSATSKNIDNYFGLSLVLFSFYILH